MFYSVVKAAADEPKTEQILINMLNLLNDNFKHFIYFVELKTPEFIIPA